MEISETSKGYPDSEDHEKSEAMKLSPTVASIKETLQQQEVVDAATFIEAILTRHPEYLNKEANRFIPLTPTTEKRPVTEWLDKIQPLFDPHSLQALSQPNSPPLLHGRLVIAGLYLLEPDLHEQLDKHDFFDPLLAELDEPFEKIITDTGRSFLNKFQDKTPAPDVEDSVPNQPDNPLQEINKDQLGRAAFARFLAERIKAVPDGSGAYSMHVYGPWGSGKSTLLNFIREELNTTDEWVVTEFNAWRNQHIRPPWWSLMESVFQQNKSKKKSAFKN